MLRILQNNAFTVSTNESNAKYTMNTQVRCGQRLTMFGYTNACQTEVTFNDNKLEKLVYSNGPTAALPGLNIDFNSITFPDCKDL